MKIQLSYGLLRVKYNAINNKLFRSRRRDSPKKEISRRSFTGGISLRENCLGEHLLWGRIFLEGIFPTGGGGSFLEQYLTTVHFYTFYFYLDSLTTTLSSSLINALRFCVAQHGRSANWKVSTRDLVEHGPQSS